MRGSPVNEFVVYPAIDLRGGNVVRLRQGDYADETVYGDDPLSVAESFVAAGATWVHMVDLDAAKGDAAVNRPVIARVAAALTGRARLQVGGGVRGVNDASALAEAGVSRVVMGSAAVRDPALVAQVTTKVGVAVAVGLDHRAGILATEGWTQSSGVGLTDALGMYPTAACAVITDISRDGMLTGPDIDGLSAAALNAPMPVIASGGVGTVDDIVALAAIPNIAGVITGKAIYEGRFTLVDALRAVGARR
ncbi:MAG: 1-(5-phosphoribosyl)-5-((5-phosphoribosylamino)methylideneamino)imidazole-4-carboxamide isomerase [Actinobacteria bacterium]|nr:1-(5-phosphoribosyl)-5-((5-phosphoribosylamino)methylideneamino)imidazole-4-carboxamide isomerase [Actinomycetota bacterium]